MARAAAPWGDVVSAGGAGGAGGAAAGAGGAVLGGGEAVGAAAPEHSAAAARRVAASITDPEIPVLTIDDLGVLRGVEVNGDAVTVTITPTYSGCPAMEVIRDDLTLALTAAGWSHVTVRSVLTPPWTTDWMSEAGKTKLREFGIQAPNGRARVAGAPLAVALAVKCPRCDSLDTRELARFASTSCKALYQCRACLEPFDFFKVL